MPRTHAPTVSSPEDTDDLMAQLDALLCTPRTDAPAAAPTPAVLEDQPRWLRSLTSGEQTATGDVDLMLDIAAECDPRGTAATVAGLIEALRVRHIDDDVTTSILAALEWLHLPALLDASRGE